MDDKTKLFSHRFDGDLVSRLDLILEKRGMTRTAFLEDFIRSYVALYDDRISDQTRECPQCQLSFRGVVNCPRCNRS